MNKLKKIEKLLMNKELIKMDKMDVDKRLGFGSDTIYETYTRDEYARKSHYVISPLSREEIGQVIDINYKTNTYIPLFKNEYEYLEWSRSEGASKEMYRLRRNYLKNLVLKLNNEQFNTIEG